MRMSVPVRRRRLVGPEQPIGNLYKEGAKPKLKSVQSPSGMPRQARLHFLSLRSSLVNLPVSLFGPLLERNIASPSFFLSTTH